MKGFFYRFLAVFSTICFVQKGISQAANDDFRPLTYNHSGLLVDLSVGLWAWPVPIDFDDDGDMDLLVSCPDKPYNGTYFFENLSGGANPHFAPAKRLTGSFKDIQVSFVDNQPRVLTPGFELIDFKNQLGARQDSLFSIRELAPDFPQKPRFNQWKMVDYDNDGDLDIMIGVDDWSAYGWDNAYNSEGKWTNGPLHGYVYFIENEKGNYTNRGRLKAAGKEIDQYGAPSPNFADFDGDGDLDLICGEFLDKFTWYENIGTREKPVFAAGRALKNKNGTIKMDLEMIIPVAVDFDKDGYVDLVVGDEDGRVAFIRNTGKTGGHMPQFDQPVYFRQQADLLKFGALVTPVSVDWDEDGDEDLIAGNSAGYIGFIENLGLFEGMPRWAAPAYLQANGTPIRIQAGLNGSIQGPAEAKWGYTTLSVADWDGDGRKDILINSIWGKVEWFKNIGKPGSPRLAVKQSVKVNWQQPIPPQPKWTWWKAAADELATQWRTTPYAYDWNKDGLMDLVMLDHEGFLTWFERIKDKKNGRTLLPGKRIFYGSTASGFDAQNRVLTPTPGLLQLNGKEAGSSGRRKLTITDWNEDGLPDLIVNSVNAALFLNKGADKGLWQFEHVGNLSEKILAGHTTSPTMVNWGIHNKGLLVGAEDGHFYWLKK